MSTETKLTDPIVCDADIIVVEVTLKIKGQNEKWLLSELDGHRRDAWMDFIQSRVTFGGDGKATGTKKLSGLHKQLLCLSLYRLNDAGEPVYMTDVQAQALPSRVQETLFNRINVLSGLDQDARTVAKNV